VTQTADFSGQVKPREADILNVDDIPEDNVEGDSSVLIAEQKADLYLASYWKAAEAGRPYVVVHRGILYHEDQMDGQPVCHLCVPEGRRASVLRLDDDSVCAVVNDADADFGRVVTLANVVVSDLPSARIEEAKLEHLDAQQSQQLLQLLDEFADRFNYKAQATRRSTESSRRRISSRGRCDRIECQTSSSQRSTGRSPNCWRWSDGQSDCVRGQTRWRRASRR